MFCWNSLSFLMIQWILAILSLVPLPFSTCSLNFWKFTIHVLLKPGLENFEHYFASVWDECNYVPKYGIHMANKHIKRCLTSLIIREMQIKTTMRYYVTSVRMAIIKKSTNNKCWWQCGEKGPLLHCWWECKLIQPLWKTVWRFFKKLGIKPPYDPAIPLLGIYPKETKIEKDICIPLFIAALFTIARTWKQPRCLSIDEWIKKLWYIYTMEYYIAMKRNTFESVLMRWINLECLIQSEVSQEEKEKYHILMHIYRI